MKRTENRRREGALKHFALLYDYVPDFRERRAPFRGAHLAYVKTFVEKGALVLGGAFADEPAGAMLLFTAESAAQVEAFARGDPYVQNGIVTGWRVREWVTVVGEGALTPV